MNELLTSLIFAVLAALTAWVTKSLIPFIQTKTALSVQQDINYWVSVAVSAAEQIFKGTGKGTEKFAYVIEFLETQGITLAETELEALIESAVLKLKAGIIP